MGDLCEFSYKGSEFRCPQGYGYQNAEAEGKEEEKKSSGLVFREVRIFKYRFHFYFCSRG